MGFTDHCDIFASFHEEGFNRIIGHIRRQRPSLFNYATQDLADKPKLLCKAIEVHPIVKLRNDPSVTIAKPLPIPGSNCGVNFAVQVVDFQVDFHPGDAFNLPPELDPPLKAQRLAIKVKLCGGIGCPPKEIVDELIPRPSDGKSDNPNNPFKPSSDNPKGDDPIIVLPTRKLNCFCLDAYITGGIRIATYNSKPYLEPFLDGFEIVDIKPVELENSLECFLGLMFKLVLIPKLRILLQHAPLNLTQGATDLFPKPTNVSISPTPVSGDVPNNPAIEEDLLKVFIKAEVF
jgi:hypothetical protein